MPDLTNTDDDESIASMAAAFGDDVGDLVTAVEADDTPPQESLQDLIHRLDVSMAELREKPGSALQSVSISRRERLDVKSSKVDNATRYVVFETAGHRAALPLLGIGEIERLPDHTPLPRMPPWLRGIANLRGQITSVTDLAALIGVEGHTPSVTQKVIVVRSATADATTALVVDRVVGIRNFAGQICDRPDDLTDPLAALSNKMAHTEDGLVLLVDPDRLLSHPDMTPFMNRA